MKELHSFVPRAQRLVNELSEEMNEGRADLRLSELRILEFIHELGHHMLQEVVEGVLEPVYENQVVVEGKKARYKDQQQLRFRDRFGATIIRMRRRYAVEGERGGWYPLDERLGMDKCAGYSPLMSYLLALCGARMPYGESAETMEKLLGFSISATAVQRNTEQTGRRIAHHPLRIIPERKQSEGCELMVVEVDGTMSPQIHQEPGISGRESLKQPTEYKECNVIVIEKFDERNERLDRWSGAHYGNRESFEQYAAQTGLRMGQLQARTVVFLGDGAPHNWEICRTEFCDAVEILDFYHALEHLGKFCDLYEDADRRKRMYRQWEGMIYEGQVLQVIEEMRTARNRYIENRDEGQRHINYFVNNLERMGYDEYRSAGYPIGSGLVEGRCKLLIGKRFKGNGMRWKRADNEAVLDVRLAVFNNILQEQFDPKPREWQIAS